MELKFDVELRAGRRPNRSRCVTALAASLTTMGMAMGFATSSQAMTLFMVDPNPGGTAVKLTNVKDSVTDLGSVLSAGDVSISVAGASDFAGGDATIKPSGSVALTDLIFTPASSTAFDSFSFRGQDLSANQTIDVIVTDQANQTQSFSFNVDKANQDFTRFGVIADLAGETIKSVEIQNSGGFKEAKQFDFDIASPGNAIPEPATWAVMLIGFGGLGAAMRARRARAAA